MLKRENEFEKNKQMEEMEKKYNIEELFQNIVLKEENEKKEKQD